MDKNVLVPVLAGLGLGWLAFHPGGQEVARGLGQTVMPALSGGKPFPVGRPAGSLTRRSRTARKTRTTRTRP